MTSQFGTLPKSREEVANILPHRHPMAFIERVLRLDTNHIEVETLLEPTWPCFDGHFPESPIFPGVLLVETTAQAAALLVMMTSELGDDQFLGLASIDQAKFKKPLYPNETIRVQVEIVKARRGVYKFAGIVSRDDVVVAELKFSAALMTF